MLRLTKLSNQYKKRTLRVLYGQTQAYPYAATLDSGFDRTTGQLSGANAITGVKAAINPGSVAIKKAGETVTLAGGGTPNAFGFFANFVGGEMDELGDRSEVGVWRGVGSVYEILAPLFDDTNISGRATAEDGVLANEVYLYSTAKGHLQSAANNNAVSSPRGLGTTPATDARPAARLVQRLSSTAIVVESLV